MPELQHSQRTLLGGLGLVAVLAASGAAIGSGARTAAAGDEYAPYTGTAVTREITRLNRSLDRTSGELELAQIELQRARALLHYSSEYGIPADLAARIYDAAVRVGLDTDLAFRLVKIESNFKANARSRVGAIGLAQVMLRTAAYYDPDITEQQLEDPDVNLRIGFQFLNDLLARFDGDLRLALLAYNRGPTRVDELLAQGRDPRNGYATAVAGTSRRVGPSLP